MSYIPISKLSTYSKIRKRIITLQITHYLIKNLIPNTHQSAYIPSKSNETTFTRIYSDLFYSLDNKYGYIITLLNISSTFDTLELDIISYLQSIGIPGSAWKCFPSYLLSAPQPCHHSRSFCPRICPWANHIYLIPIFIIYTRFTWTFLSLEVFWSASNLLNPFSVSEIISKCIIAIHTWLNSNYLRLSPTKSLSSFLIWYSSSSSCSTRISYTDIVGILR